MNICILYGKIISKIEFNFLYNSKLHVSRVKFQLMTNNKMQDIVNIIGYDKYADIIYQKYEKRRFNSNKRYF